jgi:zinc-dependent metalloproteinase lipoprotein
MKKNLFLVILLSAIIASCSSSESAEEGGSKPEVTADQDEDDATITDNYIYKLPVIFHVLYQDKGNPEQYTPASRIHDILKYVNQLYSGGVYGMADGGSENLGVEFVLAERDENGRKLDIPGVEYIKWTGTYPIDPADLMTKREYAKYIWKPNEYINVMLYNFANDDASGSVTLGISHMPYTVKGDHRLEGLNELEARQAGIEKSNLGFAYCSSINSLYAWKDERGQLYQSDRYTNGSHEIEETTLGQVSRDVNVTVAHELGHYLGLHHTFTERLTDSSAEAVDSCGDSDFCNDTPSYNRIVYNEHIEDYLNSLSENETVSSKMLMARSNCAGNDFFAANIMDYAYTYGFRFTKEQRDRVRHVLYYSPLIPGPKKDTAVKTRAVVKGIIDLPIRIVK